MSELIQKLENNEAILLMYIAGELPDEERREVEQLLVGDENLRRMHDEMRANWYGAMAAVGRVDAASPGVGDREAAARQVGRMVRQWHAARFVPRPETPAPVVRKWPWFRMTAGAAAACFIGFLAWWGVNPYPVDVSNQQASNQAPDDFQTTRRPPQGEELSSVQYSQLTPAAPVDVTGVTATGAPGSSTMSDLENAASHIRLLAEQAP